MSGTVAYADIGLRDEHCSALCSISALTTSLALVCPSIGCLTAEALWPRRAATQARAILRGQQSNEREPNSFRSRSHRVAGGPDDQRKRKSRAEMGHVKAVQELLELGFEKVKSKPP